MTMSPEERLSWVGVYDDVSARRAIWHTTRSAVQLDGMSNVVSPETILTLCRATIPRH